MRNRVRVLAVLFMVPALLPMGCGEGTETPEFAVEEPSAGVEWVVEEEEIDDAAEARPARAGALGVKLEVGRSYVTANGVLPVRIRPGRGLFNKMIPGRTEFSVAEGRDVDGDNWYRVLYTDFYGEEIDIWLNASKISETSVKLVEKPPDDSEAGTS